MAIFGLWRPENEPRVNLLVGLESSKFTAGNISAGTLNLRGLDLTQMVMDIWRPGSTVFLRSCWFYWYPWKLCGSTGSPTCMHNYELDQRSPRPIHIFIKGLRDFSIPFCGFQRQKMTISQKTKNDPIFKRIFLSFMSLGDFCPLSAEKGKKLIFEIDRKRNFSVLRAPRAKNDQKW